MGKKDTAAAVTSRTRRFRQREKKKLLRANQDFVCWLLQNFYRENKISKEIWQSSDKFYDETIVKEFFSRSLFNASLPNFTKNIELVSLDINGDGTNKNFVRPRWME